jgi:hypothetical protein
MSSSLRLLRYFCGLATDCIRIDAVQIEELTSIPSRTRCFRRDFRLRLFQKAQLNLSGPELAQNRKPREPVKPGIRIENCVHQVVTAYQ